VTNLQTDTANAPGAAARNAQYGECSEGVTSRNNHVGAAGEEVLVRRRKRHHGHRNRRLKIAGALVLALALVGAGGAFAIGKMVDSGKQNLTADAANISAAPAAVTYNEGHTVEYNGHTYTLNDNIVSVCLIGYDQDTSDAAAQKTGQADMIMVCAFDTQTGKVTLITIPRNSMVDVGLYAGSAFIKDETMQACLAFSYGTDAATGSQYTTNIAQRVLYNMPISYYYSLNIYGIGPLANAIGGVSVDALQTVPGTNIVAGQSCVLLGNNAYKYVQWRDTSDINSPLDRQARQVQFVKQYAHQVLAGGSVSASTLLELFNTAADYSVTNLGMSEVSYLATCLAGAGVGDIEVVSLPGEMQDNGDLGEYVLDTAGVYQTVLDVYYTRDDVSADNNNANATGGGADATANEEG
jgi:anionic cell wall polymer biosynthesis LytR-Cps2A-Psr (LCP) family protein